ncbi:MAG: hypothetical protein CL521_01275 [Actinobacteria bacterium]|nr:hypothetical protein [Actinomycetota bacterium]|tara:strand:- start:569 stop:754 length:186 start_codon:yes stop_codon:yes gene_type:complete
MSAQESPTRFNIIKGMFKTALAEKSVLSNILSDIKSSSKEFQAKSIPLGNMAKSSISSKSK